MASGLFAPFGGLAALRGLAALGLLAALGGLPPLAGGFALAAGVLPQGVLQAVEALGADGFAGARHPGLVALQLGLLEPVEFGLAFFLALLAGQLTQVRDARQAFAVGGLLLGQLAQQGTVVHGRHAPGLLRRPLGRGCLLGHAALGLTALSLLALGLLAFRLAPLGLFALSLVPLGLFPGGLDPAGFLGLGLLLFALGLFARGLDAPGFLGLGLLALGLFTLCLFTLCLFTLRLFTLRLLALRLLALGLLALGLLALGLLALGLFTLRLGRGALRCLPPLGCRGGALLGGLAALGQHRACTPQNQSGDQDTAALA